MFTVFQSKFPKVLCVLWNYDQWTKKCTVDTFNIMFIYEMTLIYTFISDLLTVFIGICFNYWNEK